MFIHCFNNLQISDDSILSAVSTLQSVRRVCPRMIVKEHATLNTNSDNSDFESDFESGVGDELVEGHRADESDDNMDPK